MASTDGDGGPSNITVPDESKDVPIKDEDPDDDATRVVAKVLEVKLEVEAGEVPFTDLDGKPDGDGPNAGTDGDPTPLANGAEVAAAEEGLSKRARKKLLKRQQWLQTKPERRAKEKERRKAKMEQKKRENDFELSYYQSRKRLKESTMADSSCRVGVVVDMGFDELMHQKDLGKCCKQLLHCYSINRRLDNPMQYHITGMSGKSEKEMEKHEGFRNWDCGFHSDSYDTVFPREKLVYLTSESENVLQSLDDDKFYVIGGLVDHNSEKGLCHRLAVEKNISHARLPIDEYVTLKTRKVLTIDHVFRILALVSSGKTWKEAFLEVVPARKGVEEKKEVIKEES